MLDVPFVSFPLPPPDAALERVSEILDPVLVPLGFAGGQLGAADGRAQVIFCRGEADSVDDGCVDLVIDLLATPDWHVTAVRYWGYPADRWQLPFDTQGSLDAQLAGLAVTLPDELA
jgi:hypothetical protein